MAGLDLLTRKSLEHGSEASILITNSFSGNNDLLPEEDHWSWKTLKDRFCIKNAESLFGKYQSRIQHAKLMLALTANIVSGVSSIILMLCLSAISSNLIVPIALRTVLTLSSLVLYILSYQEQWFFSNGCRITTSFFLLILMATSDVFTTIQLLIYDTSTPSLRFTAHSLLICTFLLPFPRWYQVGMATAVLTALELVITGLSYSRGKESVMWNLIPVDIVFYVTLALVGLYIRFLMEFTNRKAFLDRRECFESKFHLQYEKDQEERLLLSVLPKHISSQVKLSIREAITRIDHAVVPQRPFTELFVEKHKDVSILYADIVNSVALTASLNAHELVETLNELFGRFDDKAEENRCLRIKLLGDCYYCVTGMPDSDAQHADHCVRMALDMIDIIKTFREETNVNVDMRIGVHSGNVLSGLLGLRKWQFDIWSRDVTIASRMEQSGRPGCVHISKATEVLLKGDYFIEACNGNIRDEYLSKLNMQTFFITPFKNQPIQKDSLHVPVKLERSPSFFRRASSLNQARMQRKLSSAVEVLSSRRRTVLGFSLLQFQQMLSQVNEFMENAIDSMALSKKDQWFKSDGIQPFFLVFRNKVLELPFLSRIDPLFKYSLFSSLLICFVLTTIKAIGRSRFSMFWIASCVSFIVILASIILSWFPVFGENIKKSSINHMLKDVMKSVFVRIFIFILVTFLLMTISLMGLEDCHYENLTSCNGNVTQQFHISEACQNPMYFTWCAILSMLSVSVFLRIHLYLKCFVNGVFLIYFSCIIYSHRNLFCKSHLQDWNLMTPSIDQIGSLVIIFITLHLLDRQVEYIGRLDFLWQRKLKKEQEEAKTMGLVNRTLLQNILPVHVAQYYLTKESMHLDLDLYHEEYNSVAVMFASIPNYMDFYSESLLNDEGRMCLQVLHEITCCFDTLLYEPPFLKLEKIKTIGSTYMAAAGLQPGRNSSRTSYESFGQEEDGIQNVLVMVKFAMTIIDTLQEMNREKWQKFHLRIGIAIGPVLAGVVGASKPQYDIWGDTVNIASRMDSTGVINAIQVTERAAHILIDHSKYDVKCRGKTFVKGKGWMTTYLVQHHSETTRL